LPDDKSPTEHLADAQDTLYALEESARGLRTQMRANGWADETSERVAAHWFSRSIDVGMAYVEAKTEGKWDLLAKVITITAGLLSIPTVIFVSITLGRWALG